MTQQRTSSSATRVLTVFKALRGHTLNGLSNKELAKSLGYPPSAVTRALCNLIEAGLVIKLDNGRFAHSIQTLQIAQAHAEHCAQLQQRITEINQRIAAGAIL